MNPTFHFVTKWRVAGSPEQVFSVLRAGKQYPLWWPAYEKVEEVDEHTLNVTVRAPFGYRLCFTVKRVYEKPFEELTLISHGELVGEGRWRLVAQGAQTEVVFYWDVAFMKKGWRRLSWLVRPILAWNHDRVMRQGEMGLLRRLKEC